MMTPRKLIVIGGATASGKSAVAVSLAKKLNGEVVNCDSMQIYRGMDIGTATPTEEEMQGVKHHLLSVLEPGVPCSASIYRDMALPVLEDIQRRGKTPILCGGTGLYIDALTRPMGFAVKGEEALRERLKAMDSDSLHAYLAQIDPQSAARLHKNDRRRVVRAIEIYELTGKTLSQHMLDDRDRPGDYEALLFVLDWPREELYRRIDTRVERMVEEGLLREVRALLDSGIDASSTALQAIGYKEMVEYLEGGLTLEEAVEEIAQASRRYAKRQMTWLRRDERAVHLDAAHKTSDELACEIIDRL